MGPATETLTLDWAGTDVHTVKVKDAKINTMMCYKKKTNFCIHICHTNNTFSLN